MVRHLGSFEKKGLQFKPQDYVVSYIPNKKDSLQR